MGGRVRADVRVGPEVVPDKTRTAFLDIARGLAAILVVYTHIYDVYIRAFKDVRTPPTDAIDNVFVIPLKLDDQGIGAVSVPIFFIISGFVVTPIALKLGPRRFGINRLFRVYPLLIFVVAFSALLIALGNGLLSTKPQPVNVWTFLSNASLWNYIDRPFGAWVAVAWTLAVEVLFYATLVAVLPLLRRRMWLAISVQLWFVLMLLITYRAFADEYRAFVINMVYVLIPIMGQAIWAAWTGRIPAWLAGAFITAAWLMFVWAGYLKVDPEYIPRPFPIAFALMLFLIGLFAEPYLRQRRFWTELSERTYSIYLLHGSVAFPLMHWLFDRLPLWLTVLIAVVATGLAAELSYRFVERPSHNLARRLSKRRVEAPEPEPVEDADEYDVDEYEDDLPTEKVRPVVRVPMRRPEVDDRPTVQTVEDRRPATHQREHAWPESEDARDGTPLRNGRRRAIDTPAHLENGWAPSEPLATNGHAASEPLPRSGRRRALDETPVHRNGRSRTTSEPPVHNGKAEWEPPGRNGSSRPKPAHHDDGQAEDETPIHNGHGRATNGTHRAVPTPSGAKRASTPAWPGDQEDQDVPRSGRHRRD